MKRKILVTVKTYPCISAKHKEVVCTAGLTRSGNWIRIYPIAYRFMDAEKKFSKYQWIEAELIKNTNDPRSESYRIVGDITPLEFIATNDNWLKRRKIVLKNVYTDLDKLINEARDIDNYISLATFKPKKIIGFQMEKETSKLDAIKKRKTLEKLLSNLEAKTLVKKVPYKFFYVFIDENGKRSRLQILDWEIYQLCRKLILKYGKKRDLVYKHLREKYFNEFTEKRDVYLFLGTNKYWHIRRSKNPFMIIGVFYPPKVGAENKKM